MFMEQYATGFGVWAALGDDKKTAASPRVGPVRPVLVISAFVALIAGALVALPSGASAAGVQPTGTVVATAPSPNGPVLVVGSGTHQGYGLYFITSDAPPKFACTTTVVVIAPGVMFPCTGPADSKTADWPALTTVGRPVAGPGVIKSLLGSVKRPDLQADQVTYAGHPLYLFDPMPSQFTGNNLDQPSAPPDHGVWYLVSPKRGLAAPPVASLTTVTLQVGRRVLGAVMNAEGSSGPTPVPFPVYSYSRDPKGRSACQGPCAIEFPPLLTAGLPQVAPSSGLDQHGVGVVVRADGTRQVTYNGHALYLDGSEKNDPVNPSTPFSGSGDGVKPSVRLAGSFSLVPISAS